MYRDDMPAIRDAMRHDVQVFRRGVMFAICSIRQPILAVPDQMDALFDKTAENPLFGHKFDAWAWISDDANCAPLWEQVCWYGHLHDQYPKTARHPTAAAMLALLHIPGLGIVKAAFILQLMGFDIACLDSRNNKREGRNPRAYETRGAKSGRKFTFAMVARYINETFGRAQEYWDQWCYDVAAANDMTGNQISVLHLAVIPKGYVPF